MKKILLITLALLIAGIAVAGMNLTQIKSVREAGDVVYYAPSTYYDYFAGNKAILPHAPFSASTNIPSGKIDQINTKSLYDIGTDTWTDYTTVSVNAQTLPSSRLFSSQDDLKVALKVALAAHSVMLQDMIDLNTTYIASVDEIGIPVLSLSVSELDFGDADTELTFEITNIGEGELDWTIDSDLPAKVTIDPDSGDTKEETDTITVMVDRSGVPVGTYNPTVDIVSDGGNASIELTVIVP